MWLQQLKLFAKINAYFRIKLRLTSVSWRTLLFVHFILFNMNKYALLSLGAIALASPAFAAQTIPVPDVSPAAEGYQVVINIPQQLVLRQNGLCVA